MRFAVVLGLLLAGCGTDVAGPFLPPPGGLMGLAPKDSHIGEAQRPAPVPRDAGADAVPDGDGA